MKKIFMNKLMGAALVLLSLQAQAQSPTAPAQGFNVFVQNGATLITNETEGPVAMGGDLTLASGSYQVSTNNAGTFQVSGVTVTLLIGGKVNYQGGNGITVDQNGYVKIGDTTGTHTWYTDQNGAYSPIRITPGMNYNGTPTINLQANAQTLGVSATNNPVAQGNLINFATAFTTMQASSTSISGCTDNATLTNPNGVAIAHTNLPSQVKITLNTGINTLNLAGTDMNNVQNFTFNNAPDATHILVINVNAPGTFNWSAWTNAGFGGESNCSYILYNFYNTTTLNIQGNGAVEGTVFAPYANITKTVNQSNIEGQVIAQSYYHSGGENHYAVFTPTVTGCGTPVAASFTINNSSQCLSSNAFTFTNTSTGTGTYLWSFGDGTTSTVASPAKTYTVAGTYTVKLKVTGSSNADSTTHTVTVNPQANQPGAFTASAAVAYQGQTGLVYTVPNDATVTYAWSYSGTGATITGTGNSVTVAYSVTATSGNLNVIATTTYGCGPSAARTVAVTVKPYETFTCTTNNDWNTATNWDGGFVPYGTICAHVAATSPCQPGITGTLSVRKLVVDNNATITVNTNAILNVGDSLTLNGNITGPGYVILDGTSNQILCGNGKVGNLQLNNTNGATIANGDTIHIINTYKPTSGTLTTNSGLELLSDTGATAAILGSSSCNYISGNVICDKYVHGGMRAYRFLGHPFSTSIPLSQLEQYIDITGQGGSANGFTNTATNNPSAMWYNTLTGNGSPVNDSTGWIPYTSTNGQGVNAWQPLEGALIMIRGAKGEGLCSCPYTPSPVTFKMNGPVNQCNVTATCATNSNLGYNFIGNPYAANIDLSLATKGSSIGANYCVWDPNQGVQGAYVNQPFAYSYILPAYSSFIVNCTATSNNTITFHETDKVNEAPTGTLFKTTSEFNNNVVQLQILTNNDSLSWDRLLLFFNNDASANTDPLDGAKLSNPDLDFYTITPDTNKLATDVRPFVNGQVIPLGIKTDLPQSYTIRVDDYAVPAGATLYLHDKYLNQVQAMEAGMEYNFSITSDSASQGDNRFEINLTQTATGVNSITNSNALQVQMAPNPTTENATITYKAGLAGNTEVRICNLMGQQVYNKEIGTTQTGTIVLPLQNLADGMYIVTLKCGNETVTQHLVKQ